MTSVPDADEPVQAMLRALASPVRREILWMLGDEERAAGDIAATLHVTAPTVSQHLQVLRDAGLVTMRAEGSFRRYRARRDTLAAVQHGLLAERRRWTPVADVGADSDAITTGSATVATAETVVSCPRERVFAGFTVGELYSSWLGAPVRIQDGRFAATLDWGTQVRGRYELVCAPDLIVMFWDFGEQVPVPGGEHRGYARFTDTPNRGCRIRIDQCADTPEQAAFMQRAWGFVLGRLRSNLHVLLADVPRQ
jgi:DNA-binding transcriptional ArsR family regulator